MFKVRLKELREEKGMNQREFAADFGVSPATVGMWESGAREPRTLEQLQRIADYFHVTVDYLLGNVNEPWFYLDDEKTFRDINSYENTSEGWERSFRQYLSDLLPTFNRTDAIDAGISLEKLKEVAEGTILLTFNLACEIADELGLTVDEMIGSNKISAQESELDVQLSGIDFALSGEIHDLTDAEKQDILDYIRFKKSQRGGEKK